VEFNFYASRFANDSKKKLNKEDDEIHQILFKGCEWYPIYSCQTIMFNIGWIKQ
jgi:hypothetical protein